MLPVRTRESHTFRPEEQSGRVTVTDFAFRDALRNLQGSRRGAPLATSSAVRQPPEHPAEVLDASCDISRVTPVEPAGYLDGIQSGSVLRYREQRPVVLTYVAAGIVTEGADVLALEESLTVLCSAEDADWAKEQAPGLSVAVFPGEEPPEMLAAAFNRMSSEREEMERRIADEFLRGSSDAMLFIDGSLVGRPRDQRAAGIVKTTGTQYLDDETRVRKLREGHRSEGFIVGSGEGQRCSAYVRLDRPEDRAWDHALIRVETFNVDLLSPVAAACFHDRQRPGTPDARWDRHLRGMRRTEEVLRSRRPFMP